MSMRLAMVALLKGLVAPTRVMFQLAGRLLLSGRASSRPLALVSTKLTFWM